VSTPRFKPSEPVDFLVIGAGAAGGVVAKELSTAGLNVVVLEQGRIAEAGAHDDLLDRGGVYARLYEGQFVDEPAAEPERV